MTLGASQIQRGLAIPGANRCISATRQDHPHRGGVVLPDGIVQGGVAIHRTLLIDGDAVIDQHTGGFGATGVGGRMQGRGAHAWIKDGEIGAGGEEPGLEAEEVEEDANEKEVICGLS